MGPLWAAPLPRLPQTQSLPLHPPSAAHNPTHLTTHVRGRSRSPRNVSSLMTKASLGLMSVYSLSSEHRELDI